MDLIYEEEGPRWRDEAGTEQVGWPHDGFRVELRRAGPDAWALTSRRRHIDRDDGEQTESATLTTADTVAWLAGRDPLPVATLERHFQSAFGDAEVVWRYAAGGRDVALVRLGAGWFEQTTAGRAAIPRETARRRLLKFGCPKATVGRFFHVG
jgi:hypothetical protein